MSKAKKSAEKTEEISRKIWLAGLGAYGQSYDNLHSGYEKMSDQAREFFEELVSRGEKLETDTRSTIKSTGKRLKQKTRKNRDVLNKQLTELKGKVSSHMAAPSLHKEELLVELQSGITRLTETLNKLISKKPKTPEKPDKPATRAKTTAKAKTATAKAAAKPAATKTSAKKAAPGKSTAGKSPAAKPATAKPATARPATARKAPAKTAAARQATETKPRPARKPRAAKATAAPQPAAAPASETGTATVS